MSVSVEARRRSVARIERIAQFGGKSPAAWLARHRDTGARDDADIDTVGHEPTPAKDHCSSSLKEPH